MGTERQAMSGGIGGKNLKKLNLLGINFLEIAPICQQRRKRTGGTEKGKFIFGVYGFLILS